MNYWLMKSEPNAYCIDDLKSDKRSSWDGVRNIMRDDMKVGDLVLFYHSNANPPGVAGIAKVCKTAHPDHTALDKKSPYYDPRASEEKPIWMMVDVAFVKKFSRIIPLAELKTYMQLSKMVLLKKGMRLSVQPVTKAEFQFISNLC